MADHFNILDTRASSSLGDAASLYIPLTQRAAADGVCTLDSGAHAPVAQLGSGTANSGVYLRGDGAWSATGAILATIADAKGDLIAGSAADTVARLAVGSDGQVLTSASGAGTGLAWATPAASAASIVNAKGDLIAATAAAAVTRLAVGSDGQVLTASAGAGSGLVWTTPASASGWVTVVSVTADGTTDMAPTIQAVLDGLASSHSRSVEVVVEPAYPYTSGAIYLNGKVRISTSNTKVRFTAPVLLGTGIDPDGNGGLSILGSVTGSQTVSSGATRGNTVLVVASATGFAVGQLVKISDTFVPTGGAQGDRQEMAEIIEISGTSIYLDHPLHHTYSGTITLSYLAPVTGSGFEDVNATFTGQQAAAFLFPCKMQYARYCFMRNVHLRGNAANSWSREAINVRNCYRSDFENCSVSFSWDYNVAGTYSYGFSCDGSTRITYSRCVANSLRHGFSADRASASLLYFQCISDSAIASGFDLHGRMVRDVVYVGCTASGAPDGRHSQDGLNYGFLAGNTTFTDGAQYVTYVGCVARNFVPYTRSTGVNDGAGSGFAVVDGSNGVTYMDCRVSDSMRGIHINCKLGTPITNVSVLGCQFDNISSSDPATRAACPIYVEAGAAPNDVNGLIIDNCRVTNSPSMSSMRIWGSSGNTLTDISITNCSWITSQGVASAFALDCRFLDHLVVKGCTFSVTRRGVGLTSCPAALVMDNTFANLTEPNEAIRDSGGNTGMIFTKNFMSPAPTAYGLTPTSTSAHINILGPTGSTPTASRPTLTAGTGGASTFNPTTGKWEVWSGSAWVATAVLV